MCVLKYVDAEDAGKYLMRFLYGLKYATLYTGLAITCVTHKSKGGSEWGKHQQNRPLEAL